MSHKEFYKFQLLLCALFHSMNTRVFHTTITTPCTVNCLSFTEIIITTTVQLLRQLLEFTNDTLTNLDPSSFSFIGPDICTPLMPSGEQHNHTTYDHINEHGQASPQVVEEDHYDLLCHCPSFPILAEPHDIHERPLTKTCPAAVVHTVPIRTIHRKQRSYDLHDDYLQTSLSRRGTPSAHPGANDSDQKPHTYHDNETNHDSNDADHPTIDNEINRPASWPHFDPFPLSKCKLFLSETS